MATVIGDLFVRLGVDLDEMERGFASAESRLEKFGTRMFFMGSRISAGVGLPFAAASGAVIKWGMDFDKAMTESLAIMDNVTPAIRSEMAGVAKSISDFSKFSAEEGAQGFYHLASAGLDANAAMGALPIAAKFAQAGVMDLGKSTEFLAAAQAVMSTGAETSAEKVAQMARVADVLTLANNRALGTIQDFAEGLTGKAGAALRLYHKDIEEGVAVLAAYATQGTKGKEASTQLAMVLRDLAVQALKHADAFQKFNIQVYDAQGNFRNMAAVIHDVEVATDKMSVAQIRSMLLQLGIPQRSVDATQKLIGYSAAIRDHEAALRQAGGTTDKVANEQMKALSNQVVQLWNQFKNASIEIFDSFVPIISDHVVPLMKSALEQFKAFGNYIEGLPEPVKIFGLALGGAAIAAGPLIAFLGSLSLLGAAAMSLIGTVITPWTIAIAALAAAIIDIRVETGSWRDTLLALALPFGGTLTILEQLARWMGVNTQVIRDLGAIVRDVFIIGLEVAQDKMKDWGAMTMGVIGSVYEFAKDRLTWLVNMMTIGMPESMKAVVVGMVASLGVMAKNIPSAMDAVTKSIHQAREALDKIAGTTGPTGPSWLPAFFPGGPAPAKGAKPPGGGGMPGELPPDHTKRLTETEKMFSRLSGKDLQEDINATAAAFRQLVAAGKDIDPAIHERMWEAYKKLRVETTALVPEFGHLFKEEIKNHEEMAQMTAIAHGFGHTVEEAAAEAIHGLGGLHAAQMKVSYDSSASMTAIQDMVERSTAKLQDTETELHRFSESSGQAHRSTLKSNLSKIELDQNEHYRKMLRGLAMVDGEQYDEYVRYLGDLKRSDAEYLRYYEAVESGKYAASIGVNQRLLRKWEEFNQAQRDQIIATREQWLQFKIGRAHV